MTTTLPATDADRLFEGLRLIDGDAHLTEPPDLWTSRAPARFKDRVPVHKTVDGITYWTLEGEPWAGIGGNTIARGRRKTLGEHTLQPFAAVDESAWDVEQRLGLLDEMGVWAQIIYANGIGFASNHIVEIEDLDLRTAIMQMYNDYLADVQRESGNRLLPQALVPMWDINLLQKEMRRARDLGLTGFTISDRPELLDLPELGEDHWAPMWELAAEMQMPLNFHIGAGSRRRKVSTTHRGREQEAATELYWSSFGPQKRLAILSSQMYMSNARIIINLCMSTLFDRYPKLKIVSAESGIGWIPFILESLEYQFDEMLTDERDQQRRPSDYFHDHLYATFWFESFGPRHALDYVGVKNVMVETDVPHPTCLYPGAREHFAEVMADLDPYVRRRVLQDNAVELYRLQLPAGGA